MTMRINIKDQYLDKFDDFISSLPNDAVEVNTLEENSISLQDAQKKVQRAINNISKNEGIELEDAFNKVVNY